MNLDPELLRPAIGFVLLGITATYFGLCARYVARFGRQWSESEWVLFCGFCFHVMHMMSLWSERYFSVKSPIVSSIVYLMPMAATIAIIWGKHIQLRNMRTYYERSPVEELRRFKELSEKLLSAVAEEGQVKHDDGKRV